MWPSFWLLTPQEGGNNTLIKVKFGMTDQLATARYFSNLYIFPTPRLLKTNVGMISIQISWRSFFCMKQSLGYIWLQLLEDRLCHFNTIVSKCQRVIHRKRLQDISHYVYMSLTMYICHMAETLLWQSSHTHTHTHTHTHNRFTALWKLSSDKWKWYSK